MTLESIGNDDQGRPMHEVYVETNDSFFDPIDPGDTEAARLELMPTILSGLFILSPVLEFANTLF